MIILIYFVLVIIIMIAFTSESPINWVSYNNDCNGIKIKGYSLKRVDSLSSGWYTWHLRLSCENYTDRIINSATVVVYYKDYINDDRQLTEFFGVNILTNPIIDLQLDVREAESISRITKIEIHPIFGKKRSELHDNG